MSLFISSLNSGSNGNCYYIANEKEAVLVDVGISCREIERRMNEINQYLEWNYYVCRLEKLMHGDAGYRKWRDDLRFPLINPLKNRPVHHILNDIDAGLL